MKKTIYTTILAFYFIGCGGVSYQHFNPNDKDIEFTEGKGAYYIPKNSLYIIIQNKMEPELQRRYPQSNLIHCDVGDLLWVNPNITHLTQTLSDFGFNEKQQNVILSEYMAMDNSNAGCAKVMSPEEISTYMAMKQMQAIKSAEFDNTINQALNRIKQSSPGYQTIQTPTINDYSATHRQNLKNHIQQQQINDVSDKLNNINNNLNSIKNYQQYGW